MTHTPVLLNEVISLLDPHPGDFIIDGTMDGGGHARAIMEKIAPNGTFLGVDLDKAMIVRAKEQFAQTNPQSAIRNRTIFCCGNYDDLPEILKKEKLGLADGLLLDLGFSSEQLAASVRFAGASARQGRGFSFGEASADEPLLMTYDESKVPVSLLLRQLPEEKLADIIFEFGGERHSRRIAKAIKERGRQRPIATAGELAGIVRDALPRGYERGRIDPATRTFQALRIYANGELENLSHILENVRMIVKPGGRVVIITFHSLEDRIVKQAFQAMAKEKTGELLAKKPIAASREEIRENPRSRSAKARGIKIAISD
jgi:16S rRNA (cytosine1402-N4)-methyltransferase